MSSKSGALRAYVEAFMDSSQLDKSLGKMKDKLRRKT
jgi:hypothetical protein